MYHQQSSWRTPSWMHNCNFLIWETITMFITRHLSKNDARKLLYAECCGAGPRTTADNAACWGSVVAYQRSLSIHVSAKNKHISIPFTEISIFLLLLWKRSVSYVFLNWYNITASTQTATSPLVQPQPCQYISSAKKYCIKNLSCRLMVMISIRIQDRWTNMLFPESGLEKSWTSRRNVFAQTYFEQTYKPLAQIYSLSIFWPLKKYNVKQLPVISGSEFELFKVFIISILLLSLLLFLPLSVLF